MLRASPTGASPPAILLTPAELGRADALAAERGVVGLMEAAGRAVARELARRFRPARCVVLCGPGSNGGDGYVAARHLERAGWGVCVLPVAPPTGEAAAMAALWRGTVVREVGGAGVVLDALFGAGLSRDLDGAARALLEAIPERATVVAVDVPSGLDGATGQVRGFARRADLTVTFAAPKPGHLLLPGRALCGEVVCADIGMPRAILEEAHGATFANTPALWSPLPAPGAETHKHSRGHVTLLGGAAMTGAAILAARAARRVGAGLVTIGCDDAGAALVYRSSEPGALVAEAADEASLLDALLADARRRVWLAGPGLAPDGATRLAVERILAAPGRALVADAGALSACGGEHQALHGAALLTPHAGEFARLFGEPPGGSQGGDKLAAVRAAAKLVGGAVLLKGADTVIAAPDGRAAINVNAPPDLATGGTGDVLAGAAAGLIAQGLEPFEAACAAAWLLGEAARLAGPGLVAEDLPALLPAAVRRASFRGVSR